MKNNHLKRSPVLISGIAIPGNGITRERGKPQNRHKKLLELNYQQMMIKQQKINNPIRLDKVMSTNEMHSNIIDASSSYTMESGDNSEVQLS